MARPKLTDRELDVMSILWHAGSGTVADVRHALRALGGISVDAVAIALRSLTTLLGGVMLIVSSRRLAAAVALVVAMPWNVALWWLCRRLHWAVKMDCGARVLAAGAAVRAYGVTLLGVGGRDAVAPRLDPALSSAPSGSRAWLPMRPPTPTAARVSPERQPARFRVLISPDMMRTPR